MKRSLLAALLMGATMAVGAKAQEPVPAPTQMPAPATTPLSYTASWRIAADVQGQGVMLLCTLTELDSKLSGTCTAEGTDTATPTKVSGDVKKGAASWHFDTEYQGTPITVSLSGMMSEDGTKMSGTMDVEPLGVGGNFNAVRLQPKAAA